MAASGDRIWSWWIFSTLVHNSVLGVTSNNASPLPPMCSRGDWQIGKAFSSNGYKQTTSPTPAGCCSLCSQDDKCVAWDQKMPSTNCFLYDEVTPFRNTKPTQNVTAGFRNPPPPPPPPTPPPPTHMVPAKAMNVLMIAIDDMRPEMTPYGSSHMHTPNMEALANRSMVFSRAYVQVAVCMPSRNALLFSRRPDTAMAWTISPNQWPRMCGGSCPGNTCGPTCGIREPASDGAEKLGVTLPGWFYQNGFFTTGAGKIFHEGVDTQDQDYRYSWTPSTTNPNTGVYEASGGPKPMYNGTIASPSWYAFDVDDEVMTETMLAEHTVSVIKNMSDDKPFFVAVGFHKPHVPWYAPKKYWDFYPNETIDIAPNPYKPIGAPNIAMQDVMRAWSTPKPGSPLSCKYTDLCGEIYPDAPFARGRPGITTQFPFDNTTFPMWKARELRHAYWAALSYTDANIGRVVDALDASPFASNTVIALWGDHGYALGDNDEWAKQTNFEHATHIPFMIHIPGMAPGRSDALVSEIDLFPTLVAAATLHSPNGPVEVPHCPDDTKTSRHTALCTEGFSLLELIQNPAASWGHGAWSQYTRDGSCCDCPTGSATACCQCQSIGAGQTVMGYTVRVDKYRYTGWFEFNESLAMPNFTNVVGTELYLHNEDPFPINFGVEHENVVGNPQYSAVANQLHNSIVQCGQRPDLCPASALAGLVH